MSYTKYTTRISLNPREHEGRKLSGSSAERFRSEHQKTQRLLETSRFKRLELSCDDTVLTELENSVGWEHWIRFSSESLCFVENQLLDLNTTTGTTSRNNESMTAKKRDSDHFGTSQRKMPRIGSEMQLAARQLNMAEPDSISVEMLQRANHSLRNLSHVGPGGSPHSGLRNVSDLAGARFVRKKANISRNEFLRNLVIQNARGKARGGSPKRKLKGSSNAGSPARERVISGTRRQSDVTLSRAAPYLGPDRLVSRFPMTDARTREDISISDPQSKPQEYTHLEIPCHTISSEDEDDSQHLDTSSRIPVKTNPLYKPLHEKTPDDSKSPLQFTLTHNTQSGSPDPTAALDSINPKSPLIELEQEWDGMKNSISDLRETGLLEPQDVSSPPRSSKSVSDDSEPNSQCKSGRRSIFLQEQAEDHANLQTPEFGESSHGQGFYNPLLREELPNSSKILYGNYQTADNAYQVMELLHQDFVKKKRAEVQDAGRGLGSGDPEDASANVQG